MSVTMSKATRIPAAALAAAIALGALFAPAARAGDYCSVDDNYMWNCGFSSMEQCRTAVSGMNGDCSANPSAKDTSIAKLDRNAYAYAPRSIHHGRTKSGN